MRFSRLEALCKPVEVNGKSLLCVFVVLTHQQVVLLVETFAFLPVWER